MTIYPPKKYLFLPLCIFLEVLICSSLAAGGVIFNDNFDNYPDWGTSSAFGIREIYPSTMASVLGGPGTTFDAPDWISYRVPSSSNLTGRPLYTVDATIARGGSGKSLQYNIEKAKTINGGGMDLYLGGGSTGGYDELYIRLYMKFEQDFDFKSQGGTFLKLFRVYTGVAPDVDDTSPSSTYASNADQKATPGIKRSMNCYAYLKVDGNDAYRLELSYFLGRIVGLDYLEISKTFPASTFNFKNHLGEWVYFEWYIKLNTPGFADGEMKVWVAPESQTGTVKFSVPTGVWSGLKIRTTADRKLNTIIVTDNMSGQWERPVDEQTLAYDDFVVSTTFVGPDSVVESPPTPDSTAPDNVLNFQDGVVTDSTVALTWTASGDDGNTGTASSYDVRYSSETISELNWTSATQVSGEPAPQVASSAETMTITGLSPQTTYYAALKVVDNSSNSSGISNIVSFATKSDSTPPGDVTNERVVASDGKLTFSWKNPLTSDFAGVEIRYRIDGVSPVNIADGSFVVNKTGIPGANQTYEHTGLVNGQVYYYSIFTYDTSNNYSQTVHITGMPKVRSTSIPANHLVQWAADSWILNHSEGGNSSVTTNNSAAFIAGFDGDGLEVDSDSSWVQIPANGNINSGQGTVEFYLKPYWNNDDGSLHLMFQAGSGSVNEIKLWKATNGFLFLYVWDSSGASRRILVDSAQYQFTANQWVKIKIAWHDSPANGANNLEIYLDDILKGSSSGADWSANRLDLTGKNIYFGGSSENSADEVNGIIDEVIIYSTFPDKVAPNPPGSFSAE